MKNYLFLFCLSFLCFACEEERFVPTEPEVIDQSITNEFDQLVDAFVEFGLFEGTEEAYFIDMRLYLNEDGYFDAELGNSGKLSSKELAKTELKAKNCMYKNVAYEDFETFGSGLFEINRARKWMSEYRNDHPCDEYDVKLVIGDDSTTVYIKCA